MGIKKAMIWPIPAMQETACRAARPLRAQRSGSGLEARSSFNERDEFCNAMKKLVASDISLATSCHVLRKKMQAVAGAPQGGAALSRRKFGAAKGGGELRRANSFRPSIRITKG